MKRFLLGAIFIGCVNLFAGPQPAPPRNLEAFTSTASSAITITLTSSSNYNQFVTGTTTEIFKLPVTTTIYKGWSLNFVNLSTGAVTVESSGANTVIVLPANTAALVKCVTSSPSSGASSWSVVSNVNTPVRIASGTATLNTNLITSGSCDTVVEATATGTLTTDSIVWTPNADISGVTGFAPVTTGALIIYPYTESDKVAFKVCNPTASSITPGSAVVLNFSVFR